MMQREKDEREPKDAGERVIWIGNRREEKNMMNDSMKRE